MGKTYEALLRAEKEREQGRFVTSPKAESIPLRQGTSSHGTEAAYEDLRANLVARYPEDSIKTVLFTGTCSGSGASTTAVNFATVMAKQCRLNVLLVDVNMRTPRLHEIYKIDRMRGLTEMLTNGGSLEGIAKRVGPANLFVIPCSTGNGGTIGLFDSPRFDAFLVEARERFDYVVMDAPPVPSFSEARLICSKADGAILVVDSEKTRRQVALKAKQEVEEAGGKLLGVVLNRRKYHIPDWLYRRL